MGWRFGLAVLVALPGLGQGPAAGAISGPAVGLSSSPAARPAWIETLPVAPGRLYALGAADLGASEGEAIRRASGRARLEVVARLKATIRGSLTVTTRTAEARADGGPTLGTGDRQVREELRVETSAADLPGLVVERTYADPLARTAYALAYLDLGQAHGVLAARLDLLRERRERLGEERTRRVRWRLRKLHDELNRLDETISLLAVTGTGMDLRPALQVERGAVDQRLDLLEGAVLPPLDLAKTAMGLRSNIELPDGVTTYLGARISDCGLLHRELKPDLILELTFSGAAKGPEFIYLDMDVYEGVSYRLDVQMTILDGEGAALTRPASLHIVQPGSPEGMVNQFCRQFERRLPRLMAEAQSQYQ